MNLASFAFVLAVMSSQVSSARVFSDKEEILLTPAYISEQDNSIISFAYKSLPLFDEKMYPAGGNRGELAANFFGRKLENIGIRLNYKVDQNDVLLFKKQLNQSDLDVLDEHIRKNYYSMFLVDDLPVYGHIGSYSTGKTRFFTHIDLSIGFNDGHIVECNMSMAKPVELDASKAISFTYSTKWVQSTISYQKRFQKYRDYQFYEHPVHKYSVMNASLMFLLFFVLVLLVYNRVSSKESGRSIQASTFDEFDGDSTSDGGWKLLHGDVYREPVRVNNLSVLTGIGIHLCAFLLFLSVLCFFKSYYETASSLFWCILISFVISSPISGFSAVSVKQIYNPSNWLTTAMQASLCIPFFFILKTFTTNLVFQQSGSLQQVPIMPLLTVSLLVSLFNLIFSSIGGVLARKSSSGQKNDVSLVPKHIPKQPWYLTNLVLSLFLGLVSASPAFIEVYYILTSIWQHKMYYVWGYFLLTLVLVVLVSACSSILAVFMILQNENHKWQWLSFTGPACSSLYTFVYCIYFYIFKTSLYGVMPFVRFMSLSITISLVVGLVSGSAGHIAAHAFIRKIYNELKLD